jgi:hypothetical protein
VKASAAALSLDQQGAVTRREQLLVAIPYYAWANRGPGEMAVWLARSADVARPQPWPTVASIAKLTTSGGRNPRAINDQEEPKASNEPGFHWWPKKGGSEWIEYALAKPERVSEVEVYWFDDTGTGQVRVPAAWRVLYKDGDAWKPVEGVTEYGVAKDRYNRAAFTPVTTSALRLEVTLQPEWSAGVQEWKVK